MLNLQTLTNDGKQPDTSAPDTRTLKFKAGDIIQFTGGGVFVSSTASIPAHSRGASRCKITATADNNRNPYHLISEDGVGVRGWVRERDVTAIDK
jgi:hypothetical protein